MTNKSRVRFSLSFVPGTGSEVERALEAVGIDPGDTTGITRLLLLGGLAARRGATLAWGADGWSAVFPGEVEGAAAHASPAAPMADSGGTPGQANRSKDASPAVGAPPAVNSSTGSHGGAVGAGAGQAATGPKDAPSQPPAPVVTATTPAKTSDVLPSQRRDGVGETSNGQGAKRSEGKGQGRSQQAQPGPAASSKAGEGKAAEAAQSSDHTIKKDGGSAQVHSEPGSPVTPRLEAESSTVGAKGGETNATPAPEEDEELTVRSLDVDHLIEGMVFDM